MVNKCPEEKRPVKLLRAPLILLLFDMGYHPVDAGGDEGFPLVSEPLALLRTPDDEVDEVFVGYRFDPVELELAPEIPTEN